MRDEIIQKALKGELTEEEKGTVTPEENIEIAKRAKAEADSELGKLGGLRQEKNRVEDLVTEKKTELENTGAQLTQFRKEQIEKAKSRFLETFKPSEDDTKKIEEMFGKIDSGKVDADFIYKDFLAAYAASNPEKFLEAQTKITKMQADARQMNANGAGRNDAPPAGAEEKPFSDTVTKLAAEAGIAPEAAKKVAEEGMTRIYN